MPALLALLAWLPGGCVTQQQVARVEQDWTDPGLRGPATRQADLALQHRIADAWAWQNGSWPDRLTATASEGTVLVTGRLPDAASRAAAIDIARQQPGVARILDAVETGPPSGLADHSRDLWITTELRARLTFDTRVREVNYTIETTDGTVYLLGIARSPEERALVLAHARAIPGVRQIVDHTRLATEPL